MIQPPVRSRGWRRSSLLMACALFCTQALCAAELVRFQFERPGVDVPGYTIVLNADGSGTYSENKASIPEGSAQAGSKAIRVSPGVLEKLLEAKASMGEKSCETHLKHIANTGKKTLVYGDNLQCTFNFSDTPAFNEVASTFISVAETMQAGDRLAAKHRYDRLGLDPEMQVLVDEARSGRAIEVANIGPVLRSIVNDDRVIERVRRSAARLLQESEPASSASPGAVEPSASSVR